MGIQYTHFMPQLPFWIYHIEQIYSDLSAKCCAVITKCIDFFGVRQRLFGCISQPIACIDIDSINDKISLDVHCLRSSKYALQISLTNTHPVTQHLNFTPNPIRYALYFVDWIPSMNSLVKISWIVVKFVCSTLYFTLTHKHMRSSLCAILSNFWVYVFPAKIQWINLALKCDSSTT